MPAVSKKQKTAMCMALAARRGDLEVSKLKGAALEIYKSDMTNKEIEDFTVLKEHVSISEYIKSEMKSLKEYITEGSKKKFYFWQEGDQWKMTGEQNYKSGKKDKKKIGNFGEPGDSKDDIEDQISAFWDDIIEPVFVEE